MVKKNLGILIISLILISYFDRDSDEEEEYEYMTTLEPITKRFTKILNIEDVYWQGGKVGGDTGIFSNLGLIMVWWKGYIIIDNTEKNAILEKYEWEQVEQFDENGNPTDSEYYHGNLLNPNKTGFDKFNWLYSYDFYIDYMPKNFMGELYFDEINGIIYFDLVTD